MFDLMPTPPRIACVDQAVIIPWAHCPAVPAPATPSLDIWQRHHTEGAAAATRMPNDAPFEPKLLARLTHAMGQLGETPATLIYVATCHQPHYRSPTLPHLLGALPTFQAVYAFRAASDVMPPITATLSDMILADGAACLLIHDKSRRLFPASATDQGAGEIRFTLLTPIPAQGAAT